MIRDSVHIKSKTKDEIDTEKPKTTDAGNDEADSNKKLKQNLNKVDAKSTHQVKYKINIYFI